MGVLERPGSRSLIVGLAGGLVSGLTLRVLASLAEGTRRLLPRVSVSFLALVPAAMGFVILDGVRHCAEAPELAAP